MCGSASAKRGFHIRSAHPCAVLLIVRLHLESSCLWGTGIHSRVCESWPCLSCWNESIDVHRGLWTVTAHLSVSLGSAERAVGHLIMSDGYLAAVLVRTTDSLGSSDLQVQALDLEELLVELDIAQYRSAFSNAGIGDAELTRARDEGESAIEALIAAAGLRGGSATKLRRRLSAPKVAAEATSVQAVRCKRRSAGPADVAIGSTSSRELVRDAAGKFTLSTQEDLKLVFCMSAGGVVVVEFTAGWCSSCRKFSPSYDRLVKELESTFLCVVDVDASPALSDAHSVSALPHFAIYRDGVLWDTLVGGRQTVLRQKALCAAEGKKYKA